MAKTLIKNAEIITAKDMDKYYIGILDDTIQVISKEVPQGYEDASVPEIPQALLCSVARDHSGRRRQHDSQSVFDGCAAQLQHGVQRRYFYKRYL